ncbi:hypothetical protein [Microbacterium caowuchunii]|uniref:Uncharacterized protein n=1 Tax=Microbacterium caowuchunii TaxID=2614638 RepID=A0A5N0THT1_9MICO|nr:hypothetical protein [Microbacterium caowuchunii]KAA9133667.1 hypothetical protein F6B40_07855 [Microbacterium caowuchunii]
MTDHDTARDVPAGLPHPLSFRDLPRRPLDEGTGTLRRIWAEEGTASGRRWQVQLIELKGAGGAFLAPDHTHQRIVGLSGPQVALGDPEHSTALRRDSALLVRSSAVSFRRPRLRVTGVSTLLVLSFAALAVPPMLSFHTLDGTTEVPIGTRVLLHLRGDLTVDGVPADRQAALLLDPRAAHRAVASGARVLAVSDAVVTVGQDAP